MKDSSVYTQDILFQLSRTKAMDTYILFNLDSNKPRCIIHYSKAPETEQHIFASFTANHTRFGRMPE